MMCGIGGVYDYRQHRPVDRKTCQQMLRVIQHRGPDDEGLHIDGSLAIGNKRLSIIDVAGGHQPIYNEDGSVVVVCNGEIYNYRELTAQLRQRGHVFTTASDTEVIVHLYEEFGPACVDHLRGMFAFAVWDARQRQLFLARDRLGVKPLYYSEDGERVVFGSEIKTILQHPALQAGLDPEALSLFLSLKYVPAPRTMFAGIHALPPGHTLTCNSQGVTISAYWDLSFPAPGQRYHCEEAYAEQLEALLRESVQLRLMSDVPFGAFLSGGLDSSLIVALMSQILNNPVKTFAVGFENTREAENELPYARLVAERYRTEHYEVHIRPHDFIELAEQVVWHLDQPVADEAALANLMVAKLASHHVKMVLSGEGGDELFAGYARYAGERLSPVFRCLPGIAKSLVLAASARLPGLRRPKLALHALCQPDEVTRLINWFPLLNTDMKQALLTEQLQSGLAAALPESVFAHHLAHTATRNPLHRMLYVDTKLWLPDDLLARGDKMGMAASIEARVPFLDHKLVEFAALLPPNLKVRRLTRKYLLKKVSRDWLPPQIINRKKQGFPVPFGDWFRREARPFVRDILAPDAIRRRGLFNPHYIAKLLDEHETGFADHSAPLWGLLSVELWHRLFIDTQTSAA